METIWIQLSIFFGSFWIYSVVKYQSHFIGFDRIEVTPFKIKLFDSEVFGGNGLMAETVKMTEDINAKVSKRDEFSDKDISNPPNQS